MRGKKIVDDATKELAMEHLKYKPKFEPVTYTAPSCWASYLINGDASGISEEEAKEADAFVAWVGCGAPVSCDDVGFLWRHDARLVPGELVRNLGADCQRYTFLKEKS